MGWFMQTHDIYIGSILDELNLRFAPTQEGDLLYGGVNEMAALQKEFQIFKERRTFRDSVAVLNVGARNTETKNRWLNLIGNLHKHASNKRGQNGDAAIVRALKKNLESKAPLPVYFTSHDMQGAKENSQVRITDKARPIHYLEQDYLVISIPMQSVQAAEALMKAKEAGATRKAGKTAKAAKKA